MKALVISESFVIRDGMIHILKQEFKLEKVNVKLKVEEVLEDDLEDIDIVFLDIKKDDYYNVDNMLSLICTNEKSKVIVLDTGRNKKLFVKAVRVKLDGYLLDIEDREELIYKIRKILAGNQYYDTDLLHDILKDNFSIDSSEFTNREIEVIRNINEGYTNKEIGKNMKISEYTVKRHISNILKKLDLKNRKEILDYLSQKSYC